MSIRILEGDCREVLASLPADSVHCCVTSPPYFGLRSYGIGTENGEIGLEPTPDAYVAELVAVFREVKRVLRTDGTLWLNLGMSYASRDSGPSQSLAAERAPSYGNGGTESGCYPETGFVCSDPGDEHLSETPTHPRRTPHNVERCEQDEQPLSPTGHDSGRQDSASACLGASPLAALLSNEPSSPPSAQDVFAREAMPSASPLDLLKVSRGSDPSVDTSACTSDTSQKSSPSAGRRKGKASSGSACGDPKCSGCGICWAYLAIPLLKFKQKDEINTPHLVAMALQADGWYLRQTICWSKPNPVPESVTDRCTKSHEYLFLLSKNARYYFDAEAIAEDVAPSQVGRVRTDVIGGKSWNERNQHSKGGIYETGRRGNHRGRDDLPSAAFEGWGVDSTPCGAEPELLERAGDATRNRRSVWTVATQPYSEAHFATFPPALIEPCILAGCPKGGTVLDPFGGAGTTGLVADRLGRNATLIELNPEYAAMSRARVTKDAGLFAEFA